MFVFSKPRYVVSKTAMIVYIFNEFQNSDALLKAGVRCIDPLLLI